MNRDRLTKVSDKNVFVHPRVVRSIFTKEPHNSTISFDSKCGVEFFVNPTTHNHRQVHQKTKQRSYCDRIYFQLHVLTFASVWGTEKSKSIFWAEKF